MVRRRWPAVVSLVLVGSVIAPASAAAARIVGITIELDGKTYLHGITGDNGSPPKESVWRYLAWKALDTQEDVRITPDPSDPLKATLRGKVVVEVSYGGKAEVEELHLVRRSSDAGWTVVEEDVERMAKDIGLGNIPPPEFPTAAPAPPPQIGLVFVDVSSVWIAVGGTVIALLVVAAVLLRLRRSPRHHNYS